jgi:3-hydroxyisobutyrate dehydrogenase
MHVAILGTGTMGAGMARSLRRAGLEVVAWNRSRDRALPLAGAGIAVADSVAHAAGAADVVITMVFDEQAVLAIAPELLGALRPGAVWMQSATVGPAGMAQVAAVAGTTPLLDTPVMGTKEPAERGTLTVLASGASGLVDQVRPVLDAIGSKTVYVGELIGRASALKLAANAWIAALTAATAQSLALAAALGTDGDLFLAAIEGTPADSPYARLKGAAMGVGDYSPSFAVDGLLKDLDLARSAARDAGVAPPLLDAITDLYRRASSAGHGADDIAAVRTAFDPAGAPRWVRPPSAP